jgi:hypothetical protein
MVKKNATAAELEAMILRKMRTLNQCPVNIAVRVVGLGDSWEALTKPADKSAWPDCVARVMRLATQLRAEYDLAE